MSKYYLIKATPRIKINECNCCVELTEEELEALWKEAHLGISETYGSTEEYKNRMKPVEKIRKVLENETISKQRKK